MKVGIVSINFHTTAINYGSILQSFALSNYLNRNGFECEVVDYEPRYRKNWSMKFPAKNVGFKDYKKKLFYMANTFPVIRKYNEYERFVKNNIKVSKNKYFFDAFDTDEYDTYVIGSDVIWNIKLTEGFEKGYFADFDCMKNCISYAASFEDVIYNDEEKQTFRRLIGKFKALSVREPINMDAFGDRADEVRVVLDPTLLLERSDYERLIVPPKEKGKYILCYTLVHNPEVMKEISRFAKEKGLKVIEVSPFFRNRFKYGNHMRYDASVGEWLGLIRNAEYVFTNSFHGCVFSVMFRKNFYCYTRGKVTKKIEFICDKLALNERMITDGRIPEDKPIDWDKVYSVLEKEKEFSKRYLLDSLENIKNELNAK